MRSPTASGIVFWDFDGTLAYRDGRWSGALVNALRSIEPNSSVSIDALRSALSTGFPWHTPDNVTGPLTPQEWWLRLNPTLIGALVHAGTGKEVATRAAEQVPAEFYRPSAWKIIDGAVAALEATAGAGYHNIIVSNHGPGLPDLVTALGLAELVEHIVTSSAVGAEKPNSLIFERALEIGGVTPDDDVWMVGDNPVADVLGAERAGIRAILADGFYPNSVGLTVLEAAEQIISSRGGQTP